MYSVVKLSEVVHIPEPFLPIKLHNDGLLGHKIFVSILYKISYILWSNCLK